MLALLLLPIQQAHLLLCLNVYVKALEFSAQVSDHFHFFGQDFVQIDYESLNVWSGLIDLIEKAHLFFDSINLLIYMSPMGNYQAFFFCKNLLYHLLMVSAEPFAVIAVFLPEVSLGRDIFT